MEDLKGLTVGELRERLRESQLPTAGKKSELIKRLSTLPTIVPLVNEEPTEENGEDTEKEAPKRARKSKKPKTQSQSSIDEEEWTKNEIPVEMVKRGKKKSKSQSSLAAVDDEDSMEKEEEEIAPEQKKPRKKKTSSTKKSKKSKVIKPVEEEKESGGIEDDAVEGDDDVLNTSNQTYDVVSPAKVEDKAVKKEDVTVKSDKKKTKEAEEVKAEKKHTPARRPSECRRSIFARLGLDPARYTPTSATKRASTSATPVAKKRKEDTVTIDAETTVSQKKRKSSVSKKKEEDAVGEEMEQQEVPQAITGEQKDTVDEQMIDGEEEETTEAPEAIDEEVEDEQEEEEKEMPPVDPSAEFWSDDEETPAAVEMPDDTMLSEASVASSSKGRRSARNSQTPIAPTSAKVAPTSAKLATEKKERPRSVGRMAPGARFAAAHAKLFAEQEFIGDTVAKRAERKAALLKAPTSTQRLATPKNAQDLRQPLRQQQSTGFKFDSTAVPKTFSFGATAVDQIQSVQKRPSAIPAPSARIVKKITGGEKKMDVKSRARVVSKVEAKPVDKNPLLLPTIPDDSPFVDRMATPRALLSSASRAHRRGAGGYTPKKGKVGSFVDTTKLSDREYQLAMDAGIVPGGKKKATEREQAEERRNRARDELLNVKRKLKLT